MRRKTREIAGYEFWESEIPEQYDEGVLRIICIENLCHWAHRLRQQNLIDGWRAVGQTLKISDLVLEEPDTISIVKPGVHPNGLPNVKYDYPTGDAELDAITVEVVAMEIWEIYHQGHYKEIEYKGDNLLVLNCLDYLVKLNLVKRA